MVDCDSQCNLTAYTLQDKAIEKAWEDQGDSCIYAQSSKWPAASATSETVPHHSYATISTSSPVTSS